MDLQDRLLRQAAETLEVTITPQELEAAVDQQMQTLRAQLSRQGLTLEMYCQFMNTTPEQLCKDAEPDAIASVKMRAVVQKVTELENLEATEQEIGEAIAVICRQNGMTTEQLKPYYNAEFEAAVIQSVLTSKVMRLIRDAADIAVV